MVASTTAPDPQAGIGAAPHVGVVGVPPTP
jgi:hypothetical protein